MLDPQGVDSEIVVASLTMLLGDDSLPDFSIDREARGFHQLPCQCGAIDGER